MDSAKERTSDTVNDISGLNPVTVWAIITPETVEAVSHAVARSDGAVSIGGGRYSMGGQIASTNSLHLDLRRLNQVVWFSPLKQTICVQAGIRWRDLLRFIDPHELSVRIAQSYGNFTVGGSLAVNAHGVSIGEGPIVDSVRGIRIVMADGAILKASREQNSDIFFGAIGGYGALGIIVEAEIELVPNRAISRSVARMKLSDYADQFRLKSLVSRKAALHHAELYGHNFQKVRSVTWFESSEQVSEPGRLQLPGEGFSIGGSLGTAITDNFVSRVQRDYVTGPMADMRPKTHWRNFQISYDVGELMPHARSLGTGTLQEYMIPLAQFEQFIARAAQILARHHVNTVDLSVRQSQADANTLLSWARSETLCVMLHHRHRKNVAHGTQTDVWTRELIDAAVELGGAHFLPYDILATPAQFRAAYPRALEFFALKARLDPSNRFRNALWERYYDESLLAKAQGELTLFEAVPAQSPTGINGEARGAEAISIDAQHQAHGFERAPAQSSDDTFQAVFSEPVKHDGFYRFLQNVYKEYPEERFHTLIKQLTSTHKRDEAVYRNLVKELPGIRSAANRWRRALPALAQHKQELAMHTAELLGARRIVNGYMEIGSHGRYMAAIARRIRIQGPRYSVNNRPAGFSFGDIAERGSLLRQGQHIALNDYQPLSAPALQDQSLDLVTCFIGLHHCRPELLDGFIDSIVKLIRPGGLFILRDHDVLTADKRTFVSLAHTVINAGDGMSWEENVQQARFFAPLSYWTRYLESRGLQDTGLFMQQMDDPSDNVLMAFVKPQH